MKRLVWIGVGVATTIVALRQARRIAEEHVPAGARSALGAFASVTTAAQAVRRELAAGMAEREAELRADLLAGADLPRSRERVAAWRAERAARSGAGLTAPSGAAPGDEPGVTGRRTADPTAATGTGTTPLRPAPRPGRGAHRLEDPDDGPAGYSFF